MKLNCRYRIYRDEYNVWTLARIVPQPLAGSFEYPVYWADNWTDVLHTALAYTEHV